MKLKFIIALLFMFPLTILSQKVTIEDKPLTAEQKRVQKVRKEIRKIEVDYDKATQQHAKNTQDLFPNSFSLNADKKVLIQKKKDIQAVLYSIQEHGLREKAREIDALKKSIGDNALYSEGLQNRINKLDENLIRINNHLNGVKRKEGEDKTTKIIIETNLSNLDKKNSSLDSMFTNSKVSTTKSKSKKLKEDVITETNNREYKIVKTDFLTESSSNKNIQNYKSNNTYSSNKTNNKGALNKTSNNNQNAKMHYESAIKNIDKGNLSQAIKDLELQKANTSDPLERAKIDTNIKSVNSRQNYENDWVIMNQRIKRDNYLNQQSLEFVNNVDAASNGDLLLAASQKFGYALGSAFAGKIDVNSIAGTAVSVINLLGEKKREKEELEAKKRAIKEKIAEEDRMRELERQNFLNSLKRERKLVINNLPNYTYPNYLTNEAITTYYYFAIYTNQDILNTDYPEVDITDIIELRKYKDGTWPFENDFKADLQKLSSKSIKHIVGYPNYEKASSKLSDIINGFGKGGIKLLFLKASESVSSKNAESDKDFWGNSLKTKKSKSTKKVIQKDSVSKKEDFWGKTIKTKD